MSDGTNTTHGRTIAFDFDGVIAQYHGYVSSHDEQKPVEATVEAMRQLKKLGYNLLIHSTRSDAFLSQYCKKHHIPFDYLNRRPDKEGGNPGKPIAYVYVDDRAINFHGQSANTLVDEICNFSAYWEQAD